VAAGQNPIELGASRPGAAEAICFLCAIVRHHR
jgi:hypothetical protein